MANEQNKKTRADILEEARKAFGKYKSDVCLMRYIRKNTGIEPSFRYVSEIDAVVVDLYDSAGSCEVVGYDDHKSSNWHAHAAAIVLNEALV